VRRELRERFGDRGLMRMFRADQNAMPLPPASLRWFDEDQHLPAEQIDRQSTKHPLGEEAGVVLEGAKDPFVIEDLHRTGSQISVLSSVGGTVRASFTYSSTHDASCSLIQVAKLRR
jgi:hypothetical protein